MFIAINGLFFLSLFSCIDLAISSLPVPVSPRIKTSTLVDAILPIDLYISYMDSEFPIIFDVFLDSSIFLFSLLEGIFLEHFFIKEIVSTISKGFVM